jgi:hypothetical protein
MSVLFLVNLKLLKEKNNSFEYHVFLFIKTVIERENLPEPVFCIVVDCVIAFLEDENMT